MTDATRVEGEHRPGIDNSSDFAPVDETQVPAEMTDEQAAVLRAHELCDILVKLEDRVTLLDTELTETKRARAIVKESLGELMVEHEYKFHRHGRSWFPHTQTHYTKRAGADEELQAALEANGHDSLVKPTVNAQSLGALCRELADASKSGKLPEWLAPHMHDFEKVEARSRKA